MFARTSSRGRPRLHLPTSPWTGHTSAIRRSKPEVASAMRAVIVGCVSFLVGLLVSGVFPHAAPAQTAGTKGRFVVVFAGSQIPPGAGRLIEAAGGRVAQVFPEVGIAVAVSDSPAFPNTLSRSGLVQAVGEDRVRQLPDASATEVESDGGLTEPAAPTCPPTCPGPGVDALYFSRQWHLRRIRADAAWTVTTGSSDIVVAVIDNGVASNHPDLGHLVFNSCFWTRPDACRPYPSIPFTQGGSHGTEVAGIIGATFRGGRDRNPARSALPAGRRLRREGVLRELRGGAHPRGPWRRLRSGDPGVHTADFGLASPLLRAEPRRDARRGVRGHGFMPHRLRPRYRHEFRRAARRRGGRIDPQSKPWPQPASGRGDS